MSCPVAHIIFHFSKRRYTCRRGADHDINTKSVLSIFVSAVERRVVCIVLVTAAVNLDTHMDNAETFEKEVGCN